jgi:hypothetical protein
MVGGPATAQLEDVASFAQACTDQTIPFDFVSTHHYPSDPQCTVAPPPPPLCLFVSVSAFVFILSRAPRTPSNHSALLYPPDQHASWHCTMHPDIVPCILILYHAFLVA